MDWLQIDGKEIPLLEAPQKYENPPRRIFYVLFKHKDLIRRIFLLLSVPMCLYLLFRPAQYVATSKVLIKPSREFLNVSPNSGIRGEMWGLAPTPEVINSEVEIIRGPELVERLVRDVPFPERGSGKTPPTLTTSEITQDARRMRGLLAATPAKNSNIIDISLTSPNKQEWTAAAVNRAAELYLEEHLKVHKIPGVEQFYDEQEKKLRLQLASAEEALKEFQQREKIIDAPQEVNADLVAMASFEKTLKETDSSIRETEQKVAVLDDQLKHQKATVSSNTNITVNPVYIQIQNRLTQLQLERDNLLQRYTGEDRLVMDKEKEIEELKKKLGTVKETAVGSENIAINEVHRRILNELLGAKVQLKALNEKKASLTRQVEAYSTTAADKRRKGFEYDRLSRDVNAKRENLDLYKKKAEEARISDAMDERKFSNAYILERASVPLRRADRGFLVMMILTLVGAFGVAGVAAFAIEFLNKTLQNERDIEDQIGLPVLATIQYYGDLRSLPSK